LKVAQGERLFDTQTKAAFRQRGSQSGDWIEVIICDLYTHLSAQWTNAVVVDGGAHVGRHTFPMAALANVRRVIAVEANAKTLGRLRKRVDESPDASKIVTVLGALQGDPEKTEVHFIHSSSHPGRSGINPVLLKNPNTVFETPVGVPATTIDLLLRDASETCSFIKLDLEGGEFGALKGAAASLEKHRPVLFFENGQHAPEQNGYTVDEFVGYMQSRGYDARTVFCEPLTPANAADFWYAWATPIEMRDTLVPLVGSLVQKRLAEPQEVPPA
jgi:FkbM family methyltransferase